MQQTRSVLEAILESTAYAKHCFSAEVRVYFCAIIQGGTSTRKCVWQVSKPWPLSDSTSRV